MTCSNVREMGVHMRGLLAVFGLLFVLAPGIAFAQAAPSSTGTPTSPPPATSAPPPSPTPDTVILKDRTQMRGTLRELRPDQHVVLALPNGQQALVRWQDVAWIEHDDRPITTNATGQPRGPLMLVQPVVARAEQEPDGPKTLPYDPEKPIPPGYHLAERTRTGKIVWGSIMLVTGSIILGAALDAQKHQSDETLGILLGGGLALGGAVMLALGILWPKQVLERNDVAKRRTIDVGVRAGPHGGTSFVLSF